MLIEYLLAGLGIAFFFLAVIAVAMRDPEAEGLCRECKEAPQWLDADGLCYTCSRCVKCKVARRSPGDWTCDFCEVELDPETGRYH